MALKTKEKIKCGCGQRYTKGYETLHNVSKRHQEWVVPLSGNESLETVPIEIPAPVPNGVPVMENIGEEEEPESVEDLSYLHASDFQGILKMTNPVNQAKATRAAFSSRGWPNKEHTGTVRDFLLAHSIPIFDPNQDHNMSQTNTDRLNFVKRATGKEHEIQAEPDPATVVSL